MRSKANGDTAFKASGKNKTATGGVAKPKRAPTPFFAFLAEFRPQYMEKHPEAKGVAAVTKAAGEKWRSMSDESHVRRPQVPLLKSKLNHKSPYTPKSHEKAKYGGKKADAPASKAVSKKETTSSKKAKTDADEEGEGSDVEDDGEEDEE